jgi:hypothetical protein
VTTWRHRSPAQAAMLNPALLALVTAAAARGYERTGGGPMPWPFAYVVAPMVLHRGTRDSLPRTTTTHLANWLAANPVLHAGFAGRAHALAGVVREGIRFGLAQSVLTLDDVGRISGDVDARAARGTEVSELISKAGLVGRWFTKIDQPATAFVLLGVTP